MSRLRKLNVFWVKKYRPETGVPRKPFPSPPLWVWLVVLAVLVGLYVAALPALHTFQSVPQEDFVRVNSQRIRHFSQTREPGMLSTYRVIALGNSLLYRATFLDSRMETLAEERGLSCLRFLRVTRAVGRLSHFEPLRDEIMDARPDLLVIQTDLLLTEHSLARVYPQFLRFWIGRQMDSLKGPRRPYPNANLQPDEETPRQWRQDRAAFGQFARFFKRQRRKGWIDPDRLAAWIDKALREGVTVLLLETPRSVPVHTLIEQSAVKRVQEPLPKQWETIVLSYPVPLPLTYFTDFTHLNARGRDIYSDWLLDALKSFHHEAGAS